MTVIYSKPQLSVQCDLSSSTDLRCTLSTRRRCPSPAAPQRSSTASRCSTLTTAPTSSWKSTATWWSGRVAVTDHLSNPPYEFHKPGGKLIKRQRWRKQAEDDWLGNPCHRMNFILGKCRPFSINHYHIPTENGSTKDFILVWLQKVNWALWSHFGSFSCSWRETQYTIHNCI